MTKSVMNTGPELATKVCVTAHSSASAPPPKKNSCLMGEGLAAQPPLLSVISWSRNDLLRLVGTLYDIFAMNLSLLPPLICLCLSECPHRRGIHDYSTLDRPIESSVADARMAPPNGLGRAIRCRRAVPWRADVR